MAGHRTPGDCGPVADAEGALDRARPRRLDRRRRRESGRHGRYGQRHGAECCSVSTGRRSGSSISAWRRSRGSRRCARPGRSCAPVNGRSSSMSASSRADDIGKGTVDVVVTEGFAGNIALKTAEGTARQLGRYLRKRELNRSPIRKLGYLLARGAFRTLDEKMDPRKSNGGVFLGLNGIVIKSHGGTDAEGFACRRRPGLRHGATRIAGQDQPQPHAPPARGGSAPCRRRSSLVTMLRSVVLGCGSYLPRPRPPQLRTVAEVDTSDEWIIQRTGIRERHIAAEGEITSDLAIAAAREALAAAGVDAQSIDLIVLATSTPDNTFPAAAVSVQAGLGITHGAAFDLQAVCSGFVFGLATADGLLQDRRLQARAGDRRGDVLAHPRLERPHHLRAVRRRRRRRRAGGAAAARHARGSRHPDVASALRRPPQGQALRRRRAVLDPDRRAPAHGRPRGVQARGGDDHRRDRAKPSGQPAIPLPTSTGSCRTRPTSASSTTAPESSESRRRRW